MPALNLRLQLEFKLSTHKFQVHTGKSNFKLKLTSPLALGGGVPCHWQSQCKWNLNLLDIKHTATHKSKVK